MYRYISITTRDPNNTIHYVLKKRKLAIVRKRTRKNVEDGFGVPTYGRRYVTVYSHNTADYYQDVVVLSSSIGRR